MGQPAAALGDLAAHLGGTIVIGSTNVLIGGRPAARQGDSVVCTMHGMGTITQGSTSVFINGMPAARMGDMTGCLAPGLAAVSVPPVLGHEPLKYSSVGQTNAEADEKGKPNFVHAEGTVTDENQDGNLDTAEGSFSLVRLRETGFNEGIIETSGSQELDIGSISGKAFARATTEGGSIGGSAEAISARWSGVAAIGGEKGYNPVLAVGGEIKGPAAKASGELLAGDDGTRSGFSQKVDVGAQIVGFETSQVANIPLWDDNSVQFRQKGGASLGPAGIAEGFWGYHDKKTNRFYLGIMAKLRLLFGLEGEMEMSVGKKFKKDEPAPPATPTNPFAGYQNTPGLGLGGLPGTILSGKFTVLIG